MLIFRINGNYDNREQSKAVTSIGFWPRLWRSPLIRGIHVTSIELPNMDLQIGEDYHRQNGLAAKGGI